jgi:hypothetical protein
MCGWARSTYPEGIRLLRSLDRRCHEVLEPPKALEEHPDQILAVTTLGDRMHGTRACCQLEAVLHAIDLCAPFMAAYAVWCCDEKRFNVMRLLMEAAGQTAERHKSAPCIVANRSGYKATRLQLKEGKAADSRMSDRICSVY